MNLKHIHIRNLIKVKVEEMHIPLKRIETFFKCNDDDIIKMYQMDSMNTNVLLRWSKLLEFDFFRIYSGHLILYAPPSKTVRAVKEEKSGLVFRKNVYTQEIKNFILEKIKSEQMTINEVFLRYKIPKTTLHKWIKKSIKDEPGL